MELYIYTIITNQNKCILNTHRFCTQKHTSLSKTIYKTFVFYFGTTDVNGTKETEVYVCARACLGENYLWHL